MRKSWFTWAFIAAAVVMVFITFNYQGGGDAVPLSEIFPDEGTRLDGVEYEFVQDKQPVVEEKEVIIVSDSDQDTTSVEQAATKASPVIISAEKEFNYAIQIASFKSEEGAKEALGKIRTQVPSAYISKRDLGEKGVWYRIYAGQFELRNEAEVALSDIKQNYDSSFIISPGKAK